MQTILMLLTQRAEFDTVGGCWLWAGRVNKNGYGLLSLLGKQVTAHRTSYEAHKGPIPHGLSVLHRCNVRCCVNPAHLYVGTNRDNVDDRLRTYGCDPEVTKKRAARDFIFLSSQTRKYTKSGKPRKSCAGVGRHGINKILTADQVREIRSSKDRGTDLALAYGVSKSTISKIRKRRLWVALAD